MNISQVIDGKRVIICGGSGGGGKTTLPAALGLPPAAQGKRTIVITIDPARRLADALGIKMEEGTVVEVPLPAGFVPAGSKPGTLYAVMLEPEKAVESFMAKLMGKNDKSSKIVNDRF